MHRKMTTNPEHVILAEVYTQDTRPRLKWLTPEADELFLTKCAPVPSCNCVTIY